MSRSEREITVWLPVEVKTAATERAQEVGLSRSAWIRELVVDSLRIHARETGKDLKF